MTRTVIIIADGAGVGGAPDAEQYLTAGANTVANTAAAVGGLDVPTLQRWGLGHLGNIAGVPATPGPVATVAHGVQSSVGNDTPTGHWELFGHISNTAAPTYPDGFDDDTLALLAAAWGVPEVLSGEVTGGLTVLERYGDRALRDGLPIVYTSSDSVLQVAAHTSAVPIDTLYGWCETARELANVHFPVGRIIARPFTGTDHNWTRQSGLRRDYANPAPHTMIDVLAADGVPVVAIGKIGDIFTHRGFSSELHPEGHQGALEVTLAAAQTLERGVVITNLAEFDYRGHARDPEGFATALTALDAMLATLETTLGAGDRIVISADHGNDPTFRINNAGDPTVDHTRERVPLLVRTIGAPGGYIGEVPMHSLGLWLCDWHRS